MEITTLKKQLKKKILKNKPLNIYDISYSNILLKKYEYTPQIIMAENLSLTNEEKIQIIFKENLKPHKKILKFIQQFILNSIKEKSKESGIIFDNNHYRISINLKKLQLIYKFKKSEIIIKKNIKLSEFFI